MVMMRIPEEMEQAVDEMTEEEAEEVLTEREGTSKVATETGVTDQDPDDKIRENNIIIF